MVSLGLQSKVWFSFSNLYDDFFFFLSQAVWTQQKWISENAGAWRTHKRLKRFASLAELKILDANSPSVSGTVQTVICYLLILPRFVLWNHFIHSFYKYLWRGWCVLGTVLAAEIQWGVITKPTGWGGGGGVEPPGSQEGCVRKVLDGTGGGGQGTPDRGLPESFQSRLRCAEVCGVGSSWLWGGKETKRTKTSQVPQGKVSLVLWKSFM